MNREIKGVSGLHNLGNTCYLNASIQCLRHCTDLSKYILSNDYRGLFKNKVLEENVVVTWHELLFKLWSSSESVNPINFVKCFIQASENSNYSTFVDFQQNDVDEFLSNIFNIMHTALATKITMSVEGTPKNENDKHAIDAFKCWKSFFENDYSIIVQHFYSQYISKTTCPECSDVSFNYDPSLVVHLPIPDKEEVSLYDCLDLFTCEEELDSENKWECEKCNVKSCAKRGIRFWHTSKYFIILLKRYNKNEKNNIDIEIPEKLDLKKYAINYRSGKFKYNLSGICHHSGGLGGGHYYATCKTNGQWVVYNDSSTTLVDKPDNNNAYCLFYKLIE